MQVYFLGTHSSLLKTPFEFPALFFVLSAAKGSEREKKASKKNFIQCVSLDSTSLIIYPEIKATEVPFQS